MSGTGGILTLLAIYERGTAVRCLHFVSVTLPFGIVFATNSLPPKSRASKTLVANRLFLPLTKGETPCLMSEIGIPYDMDSKRAYSDGIYSGQYSAMDANNFALEGAGLS